MKHATFASWLIEQGVAFPDDTVVVDITKVKRQWLENPWILRDVESLAYPVKSLFPNIFIEWDTSVKYKTITSKSSDWKKNALGLMVMRDNRFPKHNCFLVFGYSKSNNEPKGRFAVSKQEHCYFIDDNGLLIPPPIPITSPSEDVWDISCKAMEKQVEKFGNTVRWVSSQRYPGYHLLIVLNAWMFINHEPNLSTRIVPIRNKKISKAQKYYVLSKTQLPQGVSS